MMERNLSMLLHDSKKTFECVLITSCSELLICMYELYLELVLLDIDDGKKSVHNIAG